MSDVPREESRPMQSAGASPDHRPAPAAESEKAPDRKSVV